MTREPGDLPVATSIFRADGVCRADEAETLATSDTNEGRRTTDTIGASAPARGSVPMKKSAYLLAACAAAMAAPAAAQEPVSLGEVIVTASGVEQDVDTTGQAVTVIDRATIEQRQTLALSDLLATTPGVTVSRNGGMGTVTSVRIRGAEGDQTLTLIDGVRVNDPSSPGGGFDFAHLLTGSIERVEILRGPNSVPWGSQAIGGVVNVVTQSPTEDFGARGVVEYGGMDTVFANIGVSGARGIVSGSLTAGYLKTDGVSAYARGAEDDGYRHYGASSRIEVAFTPDVRLDLRGYWADSETDLDGFPPPIYAFGDTREYSTAKELYAYAGLHADVADGRLKNTLSFQYADIDRDNYDRDVGAAALFLSRGRSERYAYKGDLRATETVRLVVGAEQEDLSFSDGSADFSRGVSSVWAEAIVTPVQNLSLTAAVRHDDDDAFGGATTYGANAAYRLGTGTTLRASYAEGFKAPTLYQLYAPFYGTATLKPETAESWDLGVEQSWLDDRLAASVTLFKRDTVNQIDFDNSTFTYANIARTRAEGVELALIARPLDGLTVNAAYSYIDTENRSAGLVGKDLARRPEQSASVSADYRFGNDLSVGGTVLAVDDSFDNAANSVRLEGYTLVGLRAEMPVNDTVSVYGRVENLFDTDYETVSNYGSIGRTATVGVRFRLN
jgi:vitamin B12 transporter